MSVAIDRQPTKKKPARESRNGLQFKTSSGRRGAPVIWDHQGWLRQRCKNGSKQSIQDCLAKHANWAGPTKLVWANNTCWRISEVFLSHADFGDELLDNETAQENDALMSELIEETFKKKSGDTVAQWEPPTSTQLVGWLNAAGYETAVDDDENPRLTLKSRGCDGQVRVNRKTGRLRFVMRLGAWPKLDATAEEAMLHLANEANARGRMFRIAWLTDKDERKCEAQVDLTGLPAARHAERLWPDLIRVSVAGLELALRWLGRELEVLADGRNQEVARKLGRPR